jgi:hypothetical protein
MLIMWVTSPDMGELSAEEPMLSIAGEEPIVGHANMVGREAIRGVR